MYNSMQKFLYALISRIRNRYISVDIAFFVTFYDVNYYFWKYGKCTDRNYEWILTPNMTAFSTKMLISLFEVDMPLPINCIKFLIFWSYCFYSLCFIYASLRNRQFVFMSMFVQKKASKHLHHHLRNIWTYVFE